MLKQFQVTVASLLILAGAAFSANAEEGKTMFQEALVILSSESLQTQGMALVLSNTMTSEGAQVNMLLCDEAGDLALKKDDSDALKPKDLTPGQMLRGLIKNGGKVQVCALYLPNSEYTQDDLLDGVTVAAPPEITRKMLDSKIRTFSF